jgi:hypothetical protein
MKVTITLGSKAMEYVTGIPEEELPEILSDVLERSLEQQVRPIPSSDNSSNLANEDLLNQLKEVLKLAQNNPALLSSRKEESIMPEVTMAKEIKIDSSPALDLDEDLSGFEDLLK